MSDKTESLPRGTEVMVEKADLPLKNKESVEDFNRKLEEGLREYFHILEFSDTIGDIWTTEIYPDRVIVSVWWDPDKSDLRSRGSTYYEVPYKRQASGFKFGDVKEVERKVTWIPKVEVKIQKSADKDLWKGTVFARGER